MSSVTVGPSTTGKSEGSSGNKIGGLLSKITHKSTGGSGARENSKAHAESELRERRKSNGAQKERAVSGDFEEFLAAAESEEAEKERKTVEERKTLEERQTFPGGLPGGSTGDGRSSSRAAKSTAPSAAVESVSDTVSVGALPARSRGEVDVEENPFGSDESDVEVEDDGVVSLDEIALQRTISKAIDAGTLSTEERGRERGKSDASTPSHCSVASGLANRSLNLPLVQLEEIELKYFLKNFGKHTREVHVPAAARNPNPRMPKWSDFRVPPDEAERAAAEGKRITVLSHVDQGLRALRAEAGEGVPQARPPKDTPGKKKKKGSKVQGADKLPGVKASNDADKSEREAKKEARENEALLPGDSPRKSPMNVHDDAEFRPSLDSQEWSILDPAEAEVPEVQVDSYRDEQVDGIAFIIAYILALVERYAPEELDNSPDAKYSESKSRSHLARLYLIAPFWERFLRGAARLSRWDDPRRTGVAAMIYFCLWYTDMIPTAFLLTLSFYICQFRFFPPEVSVLQEKVKERVRRGAEAERINERLRRQTRLDILNIYKQWVDSYGALTQTALGDVADLHEKFKNLILWRNPTATWRTLALLNTATLFVAFASPHLVFKTIFFFFGIVFFVLSPLASHYPRYRRPLNPIWWALWGCPTDAQFAIKLLRNRHMDQIKGVADTSNALGLSVKGDSPAAAAGDDEGKASVVKPRKLGSFFCQNKGVPGFLHVTTLGIYFVGVHQKVGPGESHKTCKTSFRDMTDLIKTKSLRLFVWSSAGLQIRRADGRSLFFSNMNHRNKAFNLILAAGSEVWSTQK